MKVGVIMNKKYISLKEAESILLDIVDKEFNDEPYPVDFRLNPYKPSTGNKNSLGFWCNYFIMIYVGNFPQLQKKKEKYLYKLSRHISMKTFVSLIDTTFHECFHGLSSKTKLTLLDEKDFLTIKFELTLRQLDYEIYILEHDAFYEEMLADLYGNIKTREFLKENFPYIYASNESQLDVNLAKIKKRFVFFDFNHVYQKHYRDHLHEADSDKFISVKAIYDMYKNFDERITYSILTLDLFLEQLDISSLSNEEIEIMELAIEYAYNKELLKKDYIDNNFDLDNLNEKDTIYYKENINRLKYFEEIDRMLKNTRKIKILKKTKN